MEKTKEDVFINYKISPHVLNVLKLMESSGHSSKSNRQITSQNKRLNIPLTILYVLFCVFLLLIIIIIIKAIIK